MLTSKGDAGRSQLTAALLSVGPPPGSEDKPLAKIRTTKLTSPRPVVATSEGRAALRAAERAVAAVAGNGGGKLLARRPPDAAKSSTASMDSKPLALEDRCGPVPCVAWRVWAMEWAVERFPSRPALWPFLPLTLGRPRSYCDI